MADNSAKHRDQKNIGKGATAKNAEKNPTKNPIGITARKEEDFSEWYQQVILKAEMIEYSPVSGCIVLRPNSYSIWEKIQQFIDREIKKVGAKNAYFPLFIPESLLNREKEHVEGFSPEVAWVTQGGDSVLPERLAVRPTSETIMYDSYKKWIRSHKDLPLQLNQWNNVVRWEFKNPVPFLRTREFLWQEGHSAFATREQADKEVLDILAIYKRAYEELLAVPVLAGRKSDKEKFAGADYTLSLECFFPNGKAVQGCTSHHLGQNFAKSFDITFLDEKGERQHVYQNSWGFSTRSIGIMIGIHGDDKGLVMPPRAAPVQVAIIPIIFQDSKERVIAAAKELHEDLQDDFSAVLDSREDYSAGWKFSEHEMKGVCIRIELGPKDIEKQQAVMVSRDTGEKRTVPISGVHDEVRKELDLMQERMLKKAERLLHERTVHCHTAAEAAKALDSKRIVYAQWCGAGECEEALKAETGGGKSLNVPLGEHKVSGKCFRCNGIAKHMAYFAKSY